MAEDVTILIANLGSLDNLVPCLDSLPGAAGDVSYRVIVGFNFAGESEGPREIARRYPDVEQLRAPTKLGHCRAYNQLMARRSGRYVLILDDDTILAPRCLETMVRFMDAHPDVGIAGCRTTNRDGSYQKTTGLTFGWRTELAALVRPGAYWRDRIDGSTSEWTCAQWLNSHLLIVRDDVIARVGGLDEYYYTSMLEADWCLRIRRAGWKVAYAPQAEVMHVGGPHSVQDGFKSYKNLVRMHINRYYFFRKHYGDAAVLAARPVMSLGALLRVLNYLVVWLVSAERRREAGAKIAAYAKVAALGLAVRPDRLPEDLRRENEALGAVFHPLTQR